MASRVVVRAGELIPFHGDSIRVEFHLLGAPNADFHRRRLLAQSRFRRQSGPLATLIHDLVADIQLRITSRVR